MNYPMWIRLEYKEFGVLKGYTGSIRNERDLISIIVRLSIEQHDIERFLVNNQKYPVERLKRIFEQVENIKEDENLKHGKRPTKAQKAVIKNAGLNPNNWLIVKNLQHELQIVNRDSGKLRKLAVE